MVVFVEVSRVHNVATGEDDSLRGPAEAHLHGIKVVHKFHKDKQMGLKENSSVVSILLGVLLAAVAIAQVTYVILSGNENIRIFLVGSAMGIFVVLGLAVLRVVQNDNDIEESHKEKASVKAKQCPDYWKRTWDCDNKNYVCDPEYTLPDGTEMKMAQMERLNLVDFNSDPPSTNCDAVLSPNATYAYTEMVNRCSAWSRK